MIHVLSEVGLDGDTGSKIREWSSIIGIVTAIVGNILISFALNIQRYAHIRLNRERIQLNESSNHESSKGDATKYGTQQTEIAEERAHLNLNAPLLDEDDSDHQERYHKDDSNNQLDGSDHSGHSLRSRSSSSSTVRQSEKASNSANTKTYLSSPYWWAGILLMTTGEAGNFLAYGFAPASIVSPLGVVALVSNCIIAPWLLKERFRQRDFWGVVVAVAGAVTVVLSAKTSETKMGQHDIWVAITRWEFELYLGITALLIIILMWASGKYGDRSILIDLGLVGLFGGYTALSTKGVASLLSDTLWRTLTFPITYLLVFVLVLTALLQIRYLNRALQRFDSTQVIPTQFVLFTLSVIIGSAVLYRDFESATADRVGKFVGGCVLTFLGVYLITSGRARSNIANDDESVDDEENAIGLIDEEVYTDESENNDGDRRKSAASSKLNGIENPTASRRTSRQHSETQETQSLIPKRLQSHTSKFSSLSRTTTEDAESPLLSNPWLQPDEPVPHLHGRRPLEATISSPLLPSEAQRSQPSTPQARTQRHPSPPKADRPSTLSRNSMSRMIPGPLLSPLSSSLSAVVADSLRRGLDSPTRRPRLPGVTRKSRSQRPTAQSSGNSEALLGSSPLKSVQQPPWQDPGSETRRKESRSQSFSETLGDFFRIKRTKDKDKDGDGDREGRGDGNEGVGNEN
ncbi:hypothetical protein MMC12_008086 [Toensbergia leucococca]|nr:hypothetical protein [Toensbergia leucococca]